MRSSAKKQGSDSVAEVRTVGPTAERERAGASIREREERLRLALAASGMGTFLWYPQEDRGEPDARMLALFGLPPDGQLNLARAMATLIHPDDRQGYVAAVERATRPSGNGILRQDIRVVQPDGSERWLAITAQVYFEGEPRRAVLMSGMVADVTERKRIEEAQRENEKRQNFLLRLGDALRPLADPIAVQGEAARLLGDYLDVDRAYYAEIDENGERIVVHRDHARAGAPSVAGIHQTGDVPVLTEALHTGEPFIIADTGTTTIIPPAERDYLESIEIRACAAVPLTKRDRSVAVLAVAQVAPRKWKAAEIGLIAEVAERTWEAVERARAEAARHASEKRYRTLFESIDEGFCILQMVFDEHDKPIDYRFLEINPAFERQTGLWGALGKTMREMIPDQDEHWFRIYGGVALTREPVRFEEYSHPMKRWFSVFAFPVGPAEDRQVGLIFSNITNRKRAEDALREQDRRKDEFLAMLAHELRNPLAPISNAAEVMRNMDGKADAIAAASEMMERQVGQMTRLIDDLLDVSRISRGKIALKRERVELGAIVDQAVEAARPPCEGKDHELTVSQPPESIYLNADATRLAQILGNLLNNACNFTERGGRIDLTVDRESDTAVVRVRDNGVGIDADQIPHLFDRFTQVATSGDRSRGGLGLGLNLVKNLVELHDGQVEAQSDGIGRGSEFIVRLPVLTELSVSSPERLPDDGGSAATPRRILVVDDNRDAAFTLAMLLETKGHDSSTAHDGMEAVRKADEIRPDVILLDIGLPKMNGYNVCRRIREQPWGQDMVIIAATGWGQAEDRERSEGAGFDDHLVKPIDHTELQGLLASLPVPQRS